MKKTMLSACFLLVAGNAVANDGTIHFTAVLPTRHAPWTAVRKT
ncbi:TPA: hypothetical protein ACHKWD_001310 [Escherichia coli]